MRPLQDKKKKISDHFSKHGAVAVVISVPIFNGAPIESDLVHVGVGIQRPRAKGYRVDIIKEGRKK